MVRIAKVFLLFLLAGLVFSSHVMAHTQLKQPTLVALGDSIPFGFNLAEDHSKVSDGAFPLLIGEMKNKRVKNLGVPMWKTGDLLQAVQEDHMFRESIREAEVVTVTVGSNDLLQALHDAFVRSFFNSDKFQEYLYEEIERSNLYDQLEETLREIRLLTDAPVLLYNFYNPFQDNDPLYPVALHVLPNVNSTLKEMVEECRHAGVYLVDAFDAFQFSPKDYVLPFDIHPTFYGHQRLAEIGLETIYNVNLEGEVFCTDPL
ncbi:GDSL-type esterase/lipase family protein [Alteribacter aurantiacus]|uniref:GDSL-type esterase/lipase family protein n=1 Tax=Alteribacter aurantiacus TaxID=254410 RepID=UPI00040D658C|nr:GDSL-type esterase/lipase family protein [Alteribacter aurantiacus]